MPNIPFPNVPLSPGVPLLPRSPNFPPLAKVVLGAVTGALWRAFQTDSQWGIFNKAGKSVLDPSAPISSMSGSLLSSIGIGSTLSTSGVEISAESKVSDFPVESGSFATYNKVEMPFMARVEVCLTGSESDRAKFLLTLDDLRKSTELLDVATPDFKFTDCTIMDYNYQRTSQSGATLLRVAISLKQVRQVTSAYTEAKKIDQPKTPSAALTSDTGKVQAKTPDQSMIRNVANKLGIK